MLKLMLFLNSIFDFNSQILENFSFVSKLVYKGET
uniref:Uncharacterized protein n=1 Tax=Glaucocystis incrassata TaxID=1789788 RepID=A0A3G1IVG4_9EUKA|nr:hypothetical protein [Glaucocystis incrassata]ASQ40038.1 hypothetical protein [Glaucocystis incrassata]